MIRCVLILIFTCAWLSNHAQVNIIHTIAGKDTFGYSGDNGPATNAKLKAPYRICTDKHNNIYVADAFNHRIRKISAGTNIITTIAGTGINSYNGDNIPATDAQIAVPQGICSDTFGNIYIVDAANERIRKITIATGIISTIAGNGSIGNGGDLGLATNAEFDGPTGLSIDKSGNIFIADWGNNKIRKITASSGIITTIAGTGTAGYSGDGIPANTSQLNGPLQVVTDNLGNILIAEQFNNRIRKIDASGIITTIAGTGTAGYSGDNSLAVNATLNQPTGLFVDNENNIYIAEYSNGTVRKIDAVTKKITTVAGIGILGFYGDGEPATNAKLHCSDVLLDAYGNMIIDDYENNRIRKVNGALKVNNLNADELLLLYPNPTKGIFTVQTPGNGAVVSVVDVLGKIIYQAAAIVSKLDVDISDKPTGMYFVYVQSGEEKYASKILLNK